MDLATLVSRIGNIVTIALSIAAGIIIFVTYKYASVTEKIAYTLIYAASIWLLIFTFKMSIIWFIKALKK
jgi:hypothetical protein